MIQFNEQRSTVVLYTCGVCNLNCRYCTIDKNPILKQIDNELEESFKGDYYFERFKAYLPRKDQLKRIETWGGEPFLRMDRIYPTLRKIIEYYPFFNEMFSSTNFAYDEWLDQFLGLMNVLGEYPYRKFTYELQLSVDGPAYINDANRGEGVTERCIANFDKLLKAIEEGKLQKNIQLNLTIKGTWDTDCIHKLNGKQKLIEFFQFYENAYIRKVMDKGYEHVFMGTSVPNTAVPAPVTQADGKVFAELVTKCREIEDENEYEHYFKYYKCITPFTNLQCSKDCTKYECQGGGCGSGVYMLGFLPHNTLSLCHEGFTQLVDAYKDYAKDRNDEKLTISIDKFLSHRFVPMCVTDEQYAEHERKMSYYQMANTTARISSTVAMIIALAMAEEIDQKYLDEREALKAAHYIFMNTAFCIKNNYMVAGSFATECDDLCKLLLNGALDKLTQGGAWYGNTN